MGDRDEDRDAPMANKPKAEPQQHKTFVGGLPLSMDDAGLREAFSKYDPLEAQVMVDKYTGRSRAFGFVIFRDADSLEEALREMHDKELDGRRISVRKAVPQDQVKPGTPASELGGGGGGGYGGPRRGPPPRYGRGPYDRGGAPGGYDRGGYDSRGGYDRGGYESRGVDRGGYGGGYGGGYEARGYGESRGYGGYDGRGDPYAPPAQYYDARYDARYAPPPVAYDARYDYGRTDDRYPRAGGPERSHYDVPPRAAAPYDRREIPRR